MQLYDLKLSGNCYKVRLLCALVGIPIELYATDFMGGEHKTSKFLAMNSLGEVPILDDDGYQPPPIMCSTVQQTRSW